jgi:hypothetical protein
LFRVRASALRAGFILCCLGALVPVPTASAAALAGVQTHLLWDGVSGDDMRHQLGLVRASGATLTRVDVGWASIQEQGPDSMTEYHLNRLDAVVEAADKRNIKLLLTFANTPCWASTAPESHRQGCKGAWWERDVVAYPPRDPAKYAQALGALAARYRGKVAAWEIWNEPNHPDFWKSSDPARDYAALVKASYPVVKAADPDATIIAGALSQSDYAFTARLYQLGIKGNFDAYSIHPYSEDTSPLNPRTGVDARYSFVRGVPAVRAVMRDNGDNRPMWFTEVGFSTSPTRTPDAWRNGVSEARQAQYLKQQLRQVARWPWVAATVWYQLQDTSPDAGDLDDNMGLRRWNGSSKPAWAAFQNGVEQLAVARSSSARKASGRRPPHLTASRSISPRGRGPAIDTAPRRRHASATPRTIERMKLAGWSALTSAVLVV